MNDNIDINKMRLIVGHNILDYKKITAMKPNETFIPSSEEEVKRMYMNNTFFNRVVENIVVNIYDHITRRST